MVTKWWMMADKDRKRTAMRTVIRLLDYWGLLDIPEQKIKRYLGAA